MASPMELMCWGGDWGLPSVHTDSLIVLAYAKFSRAPLKVHFINNPWKTPTGHIPVLTSDNTNVVQPENILNFLRKQKYNADYELTAKEGADTLAFIALIEEKLRPALLHTFWVDIENYCNLTRPWFASRIPFPLNFYLPGQMSRSAMNQIVLTKGEPPFYNLKEVEGQVYRDAKECLNLLSYRLGTSNFFFGKIPTSFDAFAFGFLAPLCKAELPNAHLQKHLHQLHNLCQFCENILTQYFMQSSTEDMVDAKLQKLTQLVNKESNLIEKMDDNLRNSPQHKPQGATSSKLIPASSETCSAHH
ncbi:metaxin-3 isoform X1 [Carcharodon carcharias]|uniref:metaxin-3 isoform X1 n=1 Tax=Carcharodon carcharias TaxID=13397 RepID=UPI001B7F1D21|nr:metaxin-3 isoform X1 [Carcharodon carcharias]